MHQPKKRPGPARPGLDSKQSPSSNFPSPASIRRRYGRGIPAYENAKADWRAANPSAEPDEYTAAIRRIARAVRV